MSNMLKSYYMDGRGLLGPLAMSILPAFVGRPLPAVLVLAAYFDDSQSPETDTYTLGGYLAPVNDWDRQFIPAWHAVLESAPHPVTEFKAHDCRMRTGQFRDWSKDECSTLTRRLVDVITDKELMPNMFGTACAISLQGVFEGQPQRKRWSFAYLLCLSIVVQAITEVVKSVQKRVQIERVRLIFDLQNELEHRAHILFRDVLKKEMSEDTASLFSQCVQYEDSKETLPLQAADLLAYETYKELKSRTERPKRKASKALLRLTERLSFGYYYDSASISRLAEGMKPKEEGIDEADMYRFTNLFDWSNGRDLQSVLTEPPPSEQP